MTTKATLEADVLAYTGRNDLSGLSGSFTRIAEAMINRTLRSTAQVTSTTLTFSTNTAALPSDFRGIISLSPQDKGVWNYLTPNRIRESRVWEDTWVADGNAAFTIEGTNVILAPTPSGSPVADLIYHAAFAALSAGTDTNWALTNQYDVYLYASLYAAYDYIEDEGLSDKYLAKFGMMKDQVNKEAETMRRAGGGMKRTGGGSVP